MIFKENKKQIYRHRKEMYSFYTNGGGGWKIRNVILAYTNYYT